MSHITASRFCSSVLRKRSLVLTLMLGLCLSATARESTIITFDAPGAGTSAGQGTLPFSINPRGAIAGFYMDKNNVNHGFVRAPDGDITTFDAPGAGTGAFQGTMTGFIDCINQKGAMTGYLIDASNLYHGYVRAPDGNITSFDAPGAGTGAGQGTRPAGINAAKMIEGDYFDASNVSHGFVRDAHGYIINVDVPGAGTGAFQGTYPSTINTRGDIVGQYVDAGDVNHGFLRTKRGHITTFDVSSAGSGSGQGTIPNSNDPEGEITGYYVDASGVLHGFLRTPEADHDDEAPEEIDTPD